MGFVGYVAFVVHTVSWSKLILVLANTNSVFQTYKYSASLENPEYGRRDPSRRPRKTLLLKSWL
jgi:hypothetical protein